MMLIWIDQKISFLAINLVQWSRIFLKKFLTLRHKTESNREDGLHADQFHVELAQGPLEDGVHDGLALGRFAESGLLLEDEHAELPEKNGEIKKYFGNLPKFF